MGASPVFKAAFMHRRSLLVPTTKMSVLTPEESQHVSSENRVNQLPPPEGRGESLVTNMVASCDRPSVRYSKIFTGLGHAERVRALLRTRHDNFVRPLEIFSLPDDDGVEVNFEFLPIFVTDLCARSYSHVTDIRLAAIFGQVSCTCQLQCSHLITTGVEWIVFS